MDSFSLTLLTHIPIALTGAAWSDCVAWSDADNQRQAYQDQSGHLCEALFMASVAIRSKRNTDQQMLFDLHRVPRNGRTTKSQRLTLKLILGLGNGGEPVITIMLPQEDSRLPIFIGDLPLGTWAKVAPLIAR